MRFAFGTMCGGDNIQYTITGACLTSVGFGVEAYFGTGTGFVLGPSVPAAVQIYAPVPPDGRYRDRPEMPGIRIAATGRS